MGLNSRKYSSDAYAQFFLFIEHISSRTLYSLNIRNMTITMAIACVVVVAIVEDENAIALTVSVDVTIAFEYVRAM